MADFAARYAFPHTGADERRRLELVHVRAVLMHIADRMATLSRMVSWLGAWGRRNAGSRT
jgi:hypothetical protein